MDEKRLEIARRNIKYFRKAANISQETMAGSLGVVQSYYSMLERGERNLKMDQLFKISSALNISVQELVTPANSIEDAKIRFKFAKICNNKDKIKSWEALIAIIDLIDDKDLE